MDEEEEKKKAQAKPGTYVEPEKKPPEMSAQIEMLLNTLNSIRSIAIGGYSIDLV